MFLQQGGKEKVTPEESASFTQDLQHLSEHGSRYLKLYFLVRNEWKRLFSNLYLGESPKDVEQIALELIMKGKSENSLGHYGTVGDIIQAYLNFMSLLPESEIINVEMKWNESTDKQIDKPNIYIDVTFFLIQHPLNIQKD